MRIQTFSRRGMSMQSSGLSRVLSTVEDVQHCGEISSVLWVIPSDLWRTFSAVEGFVDTVQDI